MIKAVLFDIDGVLLDSLYANHQYYSEIFKKFGREFVSPDEYRDKYYSMPVKDVLHNLMGLEGEELEEKFAEAKKIPHYPNLYKVPEGEKETIEELSKHYKLAIVTGRFDLQSTFQTTGLGQYFPVTVKFGDYQKPKPDPEPLMIVLERLKMEVNEAVYVGDTEEDLLAAKALKMKFICFYAVSKKKFAEADANINSFKELPGIIAKIEKKL